MVPVIAGEPSGDTERTVKSRRADGAPTSSASLTSRCHRHTRAGLQNVCSYACASTTRYSTRFIRHLSHLPSNYASVLANKRAGKNGGKLRHWFDFFFQVRDKMLNHLHQHGESEAVDAAGPLHFLPPSLTLPLASFNPPPKKNTRLDSPFTPNLRRRLTRRANREVDARPKPKAGVSVWMRFIFFLKTRMCASKISKYWEGSQQKLKRQNFGLACAAELFRRLPLGHRPNRQKVARANQRPRRVRVCVPYG